MKTKSIVIVIAALAALLLPTAAKDSNKEADAMIQTWWASYFETEGMRVFWIVPRAKVDEILPLNVTPKPQDIERVIVGRSEILRPSFEQQLVADFAAADGMEKGNRWADDRFFPAYAARGKQLDQTATDASASAEPAAAPTAALEVHEWGTFTVLQGSDGRPIKWYQSPDKLVDLPSFVERVGLAGKTGTARRSGSDLLAGMDTIRMETPVLYFYPEEEMDVSVSATFPGGRITEVFPAVDKWNPDASIWRGRLLPPDSPERATIPAAVGPRGRHYAAARAVPDAWLFRGRNHQMPTLPAETSDAVREAFEAHHNRPKIDHFIFYRGAANNAPFRLSACQQESPGTYLLSNNGGATVPKLFALRVRGGRSSWTTVEQLEPVKYEKRAVLNKQTFRFPEPAGSVEVVAAELRSAMVDALHSEGLTEAEAAAMVATWDDLWFTEPGTRILAVLPQSFADEMVPLKIEPQPRSIERVFVARMELITREQEAVLTALLNNPAADAGDEASDREEFAALQLGRYAAGGMERAATLVEHQIRERFSKLTRPPAIEPAPLEAGTEVAIETAAK